MTTARAVCLGVGALLLIAVLSAAAAVLGAPVARPVHGVDQRICGIGEPIEDCYPVIL